MEYIAHRRFKDTAICGKVNIPAGTVCKTYDEFIVWGSKPICSVTSENAHQYFARNDDGNGMRRGKLIREIQSRLAKRDEHYQERWDRVWEDPMCQPYRREDYEDYWLWNHKFFNADIFTLEHIQKLVGAKEVR